jgi:hypothetical protein
LSIATTRIVDGAILYPSHVMSDRAAFTASFLIAGPGSRSPGCGAAGCGATGCGAAVRLSAAGVGRVVTA